MSLLSEKGGVLTTESVTTGIAAVTAAIPTLTSAVSGVFDLMVANPYLVVLLAAGLVTTGISIFRKSKRAAKG